MVDQANAADAAGGGEAVADTTKIPSDGDTPQSVRAAARALSQWRTVRPAEAAPAPVTQEPSAPDAPPADESADEADAAPPQEATGEDQEPDLAPQEPPLELPRSWTKEQSEHWTKLDRSTQEFLLESDRKASEVVRRSQNEAAEQKKTLDAERQKLEQARQQYEHALPELVKSLQQSIAGDFSDIQSMADVERMAREDWARYIAWDAQQKKLAAVANEAKAAQERQSSDMHARWNEFAKQQDKLFIERAPEFADKDKATALQKAAVNALRDIGFSEDELARHWAGQDALSLRDHRVQLLIAEGVRYREAKAAAKPVAKSVPPVVRPGTAAAPGRGVQQEIRNLEKALQTAKGSQAARLAALLQQKHRELGR